MDLTTPDFPATTKWATGFIKGVSTDVMVVGFYDKIVLTITQQGRLAQWFHVSLDSAHQHVTDNAVADDTELLPLTHLTPITLLGGTHKEHEASGQLIAVQLASAISSKRKDESRMLLCGLGMVLTEFDQQSFLELLELAIQCL
ncbi:hypothetical protein EDC01DRAFT_612156 [Geopyxis carbonaria]|nr:hypothetical protein EDC01DRAFT_612156 [Geopyxis carbonaria]